VHRAPRLRLPYHARFAGSQQRACDAFGHHDDARGPRTIAASQTARSCLRRRVVRALAIAPVDSARIRQPESTSDVSSKVASPSVVLEASRARALARAGPARRVTRRVVRARPGRQPRARRRAGRLGGGTDPAGPAEVPPGPQPVRWVQAVLAPAPRRARGCLPGRFPVESWASASPCPQLERSAPLPLPPTSLPPPDHPASKLPHADSVRSGLTASPLYNDKTLCH